MSSSNEASFFYFTIDFFRQWGLISKFQNNSKKFLKIDGSNFIPKIHHFSLRFYLSLSNALFKFSIPLLSSIKPLSHGIFYFKILGSVKRNFFERPWQKHVFLINFFDNSKFIITNNIISFWLYDTWSNLILWVPDCYFSFL